jgi:hypothetical protein
MNDSFFSTWLNRKMADLCGITKELFSADGNRLDMSLIIEKRKLSLEYNEERFLCQAYEKEVVDQINLTDMLRRDFS